MATESVAFAQKKFIRPCLYLNLRPHDHGARVSNKTTWSVCTATWNESGESVCPGVELCMAPWLSRRSACCPRDVHSYRIRWCRTIRPGDRWVPESSSFYFQISSPHYPLSRPFDVVIVLVWIRQSDEIRDWWQTRLLFSVLLLKMRMYKQLFVFEEKTPRGISTLAFKWL